MTEKQLTLLTAGALGLLVLLFGVAFWYFDLSLLAEKSTEVADLKEKKETCDRKAASLDKEREKLAQIKLGAKAKFDRIPEADDTEYDDLINLIEGIRWRTGTVTRFARVPKVTVKKGVKSTLPGNIHKQEYELSIVGPFYPLLRMINLLEVNERHIEIRGVILRPETSKTLDPAFTRSALVKIATYTFDTHGLIPKGPAPKSKTPVSKKGPGSPEEGTEISQEPVKQPESTLDAPKADKPTTPVP